MHLKRNQATTKLPIKRKGNAYVVRAKSYTDNSVPVLIALRDMLKLAKTSREVKAMMHSGLLKLNGRKVKSQNESIRLFNILEAGKHYQLSLLPTKKFTFEEVKGSSSRLVKVTGKKLISGNKIQLNLHDGSNIISKEKININDSLHLDLSGKIISHIPFEKAKEVFIMSGKYAGLKGTLHSVTNGSAKIKLKNIEGEKEIPKSHLIAI